MKQIALAALALVLPLQAPAQTSLLSASPIPEGAETRFCYYAGMAYSRNAYILVGGETGAANLSAGPNSAVTGSGGALNAGGQIRQTSDAKPLQCVVGSDGTLGWSAVATIQIGQ